jgi:hypothetical protein
MPPAHQWSSDLRLVMQRLIAKPSLGSFFAARGISGTTNNSDECCREETLLPNYRCAEGDHPATSLKNRRLLLLLFQRRGHAGAGARRWPDRGCLRAACQAGDCARGCVGEPVQRRVRRSAEGNLKLPTACHLFCASPGRPPLLKPLSGAFYRCGLRGLASADLFDERLD